jgi:hypothetical protein
LEELKVKAFFNMYLEEKTDEEVFIKHEPNMLYLRVAIWKPDIKSLKDEFIDFEKFFIKDDSVVSTLVSELSEFTKMDKNKLKIYIKNTSIDSLWVAVLINSEKNQEKFLD